jgi:hypothetical protein
MPQVNRSLDNFSTTLVADLGTTDGEMEVASYPGLFGGTAGVFEYALLTVEQGTTMEIIMVDTANYTSPGPNGGVVFHDISRGEQISGLSYDFTATATVSCYANSRSFTMIEDNMNSLEVLTNSFPTALADLTSASIRDVPFSMLVGGWQMSALNAVYSIALSASGATVNFVAPVTNAAPYDVPNYFSNTFVTITRTSTAVAWPAVTYGGVAYPLASPSSPTDLTATLHFKNCNGVYEIDWYEVRPRNVSLLAKTDKATETLADITSAVTRAVPFYYTDALGNSIIRDGGYKLNVTNGSGVVNFQLPGATEDVVIEKHIALTRNSTGTAWPTLQIGGVAKTIQGTASTTTSGIWHFRYAAGLVTCTWVTVL